MTGRPTYFSDLRAPYEKVELTHRFLLSCAVHAAEDSGQLEDSLHEIDGLRPAGFYGAFYEELGISEEADNGPLLVLEAQRKIADKAMQIAVQHYELHKEEIQTHAHFINDRDKSL